MPSLSGWHLQDVAVDVISLVRLARAAVGVEGLSIGTLRVAWRTTHGKRKAVILASLQQLCQGLQNLKQVVVRWRPTNDVTDVQKGAEEQALRQALQGIG